MLDRSGNGFHATAPPGVEPLYQASHFDYLGLPAVRFPANETKFLVTSNELSFMVGANPVTVFLVGHVDEATSNNRYFLNSAGGPAFCIYASSATGWGQYATGFVVTSRSAQVPSVVCAVFNGSASILYANSKTSVSTAAVGAHNLITGLFLGNWTVPDVFSSAAGPILRCLVYAGALSQGDIEAGLEGLGALYGITIAP
ncbi:MAG: hypothetical protein KF795_00335 [Labilithrix sp.]|nr:hypothetical protein [Labilithrix sp.]